MTIAYRDEAWGGGLELGWVGSSGPCTDLSLNNQSVLAGTWLKVRMRQLGSIGGHRPDGIFIFQKPEKRIAAAIKRLGRMQGLMVDHLALKEDGEGGWVSDDWPLKAPFEVKGRLEVYCSTDDQGKHRGPSITSVAYKNQSVRSIDQSPKVRGGLDFAGIKPELEVNPQAIGYTEFTATAAVDPSVVVDVLVPGDGRFEHYLEDYLTAIASDLNIKPRELREVFNVQNRDYLSEYAVKNLEFNVDPQVFELDADSTQKVHVAVRSYGSKPTLIALRMTDVETKVQTVSDFIMVADGDSMEAIAQEERIQFSK